MRRQNILFLLTLLLMPVAASADAVEIDGIYYNLVSKAKQAEVTRKPSGKYTGSMVIPDSVEYEGATYSVTSIGIVAFYECSGLTSVTISNSVTSIGDHAFYYCSGLTSVTIGNSVTNIGGGAFYGCYSISIVKVLVTDFSSFCNNTVVGLISSSIGKPVKLISVDGNEINDFVVSESVTSIGNNAFRNCSGLTSVTIPNSVTSIGNYAFYNCSGLTSITIPNSVTSIGGGAFGSCSGLTSVHITDLDAWCKIQLGSNPLYYAHHLFLNGEEIKDLLIPNSVTSIGSDAFSGCSGLTSISIPNSVTSIGNSAFWCCSGLTSITIPNSVTSIGDNAFQGCSGLTSVTIGNNVTSIGSDAFSGCSGLTSVTIPNSITIIGERSFCGCSGLVSVIIGSGMQSIGSKSFAYCPEITDVYCHAENVPSTKSNAFEGSYIEHATLHVPTTTIDAYKATVPWSGFKTFMGLDGTLPDTIGPEKCAVPTIAYVNGRLKFACETEGVTFVSEVKDADIKKNYDAELTLTPTYEITVYTTKTGYDDSDVATATIRWRNGRPVFEGFSSVELEPAEDAGDVNGDGTVGIGDIVAITNIMAGKE